jgi:hypothetical protein
MLTLIQTRPPQSLSSSVQMPQQFGLHLLVVLELLLLLLRLGAAAAGSAPAGAVTALTPAAARGP